MKIADINVVILCGGLGTRLKPVVADKPKILAPIRNRPFLDIFWPTLEIFSRERIISPTHFWPRQHFSDKRWIS